MKRKSTLTMLFVLILVSVILISCENQGPTQNQNETFAITQGVPADQLNFVEWKPEVVQALRYLPDTDDADALARGFEEIAGADVQFVSASWGGTVGGEDTFGNAVHIPANSVNVSRFVAVQVACSDADDLALFEEGTGYIEDIKTELGVLIEEMQDNQNWVWAPELALQKIERAEVYFQLYSYYASPKAFRKLDQDVAQNMTTLIWGIDNGYLDMELFDHVQNVSQLTVETARELAMTAIMYAQSIPDANANKINQALNRIDDGDIEAATLDNDYDVEWYKYDAAVRQYCNAWKKAVQAINNLEAPCGASVDFLPSQQFEADVTVTLSWEALNFDGDPETLEIYWHQEDTHLWVLIPDPVIDFEACTISINIDHFTRYAWAVQPPTPEE